MPSPPKNPLELPELLRKISRYVTMNDAVACAQVCKPWSEHFASAIWHTIDFATHKNLHLMDTKVLARHGHHIRIVKNMTERDHIMVLTVSYASKLTQLSITMTATHEFYANFHDLLRRNNTTIKHIDISQPSGKAAPFFTADSLSHMTSTGSAPKLSFIKMNGLTMTRDSFSSLLRACPVLNHLDIRGTNILSWPIYDKSGAHCFKHTGIEYLTAPVEQVFKMDSQFENAPSLFVHFPNLTTWSTWKWATNNDISIEDIRDEITKHCPSITSLRLETPAPMTISMLTQVFDDLTAIRILNRQFSSDMVMAILNHQETLTGVRTFIAVNNFNQLEVIPEVEGVQLDSGGWIIQSIPRRCLQLKALEFPLYEMDMGDIEKAKWKCHDLETLYIRIRGLNTKEKIDRAIQLWKEGRIAIEKKHVGGKQEPASSNLQLDSVIPAGDSSIEARVARHLLKFKKLKAVWLGWKIHQVL